MPVSAMSTWQQAEVDTADTLKRNLVLAPEFGKACHFELVSNIPSFRAKRTGGPARDWRGEGAVGSGGLGMPIPLTSNPLGVSCVVLHCWLVKGFLQAVGTLSSAGSETRDGESYLRTKSPSSAALTGLSTNRAALESSPLVLRM
jgi:hypothetical protein